MAFYWSRDDIPAMKGLTPVQRDVAERSVRWKVFVHWPVLISSILFLICDIAYVYYVPDDYPYKKPLLFAVAVPLGKLLNLIYNHYLQVHLQDYKPPVDPTGG